MFSFTFFQTVAAAQEQKALERITVVLQKRGMVRQTSPVRPVRVLCPARSICLLGALGSAGIFHHVTIIQLEQRGSSVEIGFTCRQQLTGRGWLLAVTSAFLAFAALCAGAWFLTVELAAVAGVAIVAVENAHARRDIVRSALEAEGALRML